MLSRVVVAIDRRQSLLSQERLVSSDDHVGKGQQSRQDVILQRQVGAVLEKQLRFFLIHIQPEVTELAVLECIDQCRGIDQAAASGIDQHGARLQVGQRVAVDQVACIAVQWAMQADDPRLGEQFRQFQIARAESQHLWIGVGIVGEQLAAETGHDPGEGRADLPGADHADGLAEQVESGQPVQAEIALAGAVVGAVQAAVEGLDQGYRVFGYGMRRIGGYAHHAQFQAPGGVQVDVVVAGRTQGDQARAAGGQLFQHRGAQVIIDEGTDHLVSFGQGGGVQAQASGLEVQFEVGVRGDGEETVAVVGLAAEEYATHMRSSV